MKNLLSMSGRPWVFGVMLLLAAALAMGATSSLAEATPEAVSTADDTPASEPNIYLVDAYTAVQEQIIYLVRLEFDSDASYSADHKHFGQFVLTVDSGAICYTVGTLEENTIVTAQLPAAPATHPDCSTSEDLSCKPAGEFTEEQICILQEGDTIYLLENSSISQTGDGRHSYGIIDEAPATVYLSGLQTGSPDSAPCGGGCG